MSWNLGSYELYLNSSKLWILSGKDSENKTLNHLALKRREYFHHLFAGTQNWVFKRQDVNVSFKKKIKGTFRSRSCGMSGWPRCREGTAGVIGDGQGEHLRLRSVDLNFVNTELNMKNKWESDFELDRQPSSLWASQANGFVGSLPGSHQAGRTTLQTTKQCVAPGGKSWTPRQLGWCSGCWVDEEISEN